MSAKGKVLYISYDGMTDVLGQSQVIPYLEGLSREGYAITILSTEKRSRYKTAGETVASRIESAGMKWEFIFFSSGLSVFSKIYDRAALLSRAKKLNRKSSFDLIHCRSYVAGEAGLKLKRSAGVKFLFDMRGFWVDERIEGGIWNASNPLYKYAIRKYRKLEKAMIAEADHVICLTWNAVPHLTGPFGLDSGRLSVIPCAADLQHFRCVTPELRQSARMKLGISSGVHVTGYIGSLGTWYMMDEMLRFYRAMLAVQPGAVFLVLTPDDPDLIYSKAKSLGIPASGIIVRFAGRDELPSLFVAADAGVFFIRPTFSKKASSPVKFGEMLAMGIPVLCNEGVGDVDALIQKSGTGWVIRDFNDDLLQEAARRMLNSAIQAEKVRKAAEENFDLQDGIRSYGMVYKKILGKS